MTFAILFPGQGSQSVGMLSAWAAQAPAVRDTLAEAETIVGPELLTLMADGPSCRLDRTEFTQPAMLVADVALWRAWLAAGGPRPVAVAGHSLGEYAALVAAEVLTFPEALRLVQERALAMRDAVPDGAGAMAAVVGLDADAVSALCAAIPGQLEAVNFNAPTQIVIAGSTAAIDEACARAKEFGARMIRKLPVSVPAHSVLMRAARARLDAAAATLNWSAPRIPLLHNIDAQAWTVVEDVRSRVLEQVHAPVQWVATQQALHDQYGCRVALECGPGNVLAGLGRRSGIALDVRAFPAPEELHERAEQWAADHVTEEQP